MVYRHARRVCPRCGTHLEREDAGPREFERCQTCFGVWMEQQVVTDMLEEMGATGALHIDVAKVSEPILRCCICSKPMVKGNLHRVTIDACGAHGVWFDRSELETTLASAAGIEGKQDSDLSLLANVLRGK